MIFTELKNESTRELSEPLSQISVTQQKCTPKASQNPPDIFLCLQTCENFDTIRKNLRKHDKQQKTITHNLSAHGAVHKRRPSWSVW